MKKSVSWTIVVASSIVLLVYLYNFREVTELIVAHTALGRTGSAYLASMLMVVFVLFIEYRYAKTTFLRNRRVLVAFDGLWLVVAAVGLIVAADKSDDDHNYKQSLNHVINGIHTSIRYANAVERSYNTAYEKYCSADAKTNMAANLCSDDILRQGGAFNPSALNDIDLNEIRKAYMVTADRDLRNLIEGIDIAVRHERDFHSVVNVSLYPLYNFKLLAWGFVVIVLFGLRLTKTVDDYYKVVAETKKDASSVSPYPNHNANRQSSCCRVTLCSTCILRVYC